jgi:hypothetical protein
LLQNCEKRHFKESEVPKAFQENGKKAQEPSKADARSHPKNVSARKCSKHVPEALLQGFKTASGAARIKNARHCSHRLFFGQRPQNLHHSTTFAFCKKTTLKNEGFQVRVFFAKTHGVRTTARISAKGSFDKWFFREMRLGVFSKNSKDLSDF